MEVEVMETINLGLGVSLISFSNGNMFMQSTEYDDVVVLRSEE